MRGAETRASSRRSRRFRARWRRRRERELFTLSPINKRRWRNFRANRRGFWSLWIFLTLFFVSLFAEFLANDKPLIVSYKGEILYPGLRRLSGGEVRRLLRGDRLPLAVHPATRSTRNGWMLWPPIRYSYRTANLDFPIDALSEALGETVGFPTAPNWVHLDALCKTPSDDEKIKSYCDPCALELARHGRPGPRRDGAAHLRLPPLRSLRLRADRALLDRRRDRRGDAGLFRRAHRPLLPALHRDLDVDPVALPAPHHLIGPGAGLLRASRHPASLLLGSARRRGQGGVPARAERRLRAARRARSASRTSPSCSAIFCRTPWWRR